MPDAPLRQLLWLAAAGLALALLVLVLRLSGWYVYLPGRRVDVVLYPAAATLLGWFAVEWSKHHNRMTLDVILYAVAAIPLSLLAWTMIINYVAERIAARLP